MYANRRNFRVLTEIGVEEHDGWWRQILDRKWKYGRFTHAQWKNMQYNPRLFMAKLPKSSCHLGNRGRGTRWWRQILDRKWKYGHFAHAQWKICNINLIYGRIAQIFASLRKSGSRSDFSPEVEIQPFRECAMHPAIVIGIVRWTWQIPRSMHRTHFQWC